MVGVGNVLLNLATLQEVGDDERLVAATLMRASESWIH
jgi:hypothetical protein